MSLCIVATWTDMGDASINDRVEPSDPQESKSPEKAPTDNVDSPKDAKETPTENDSPENKSHVEVVFEKGDLSETSTSQLSNEKQAQLRVKKADAEKNLPESDSPRSISIKVTEVSPKTNLASPQIKVSVTGKKSTEKDDSIKNIKSSTNLANERSSSTFNKNRSQFRVHSASYNPTANTKYKPVPQNQSDIFSGGVDQVSSTTLYSYKGIPSRNYYKKKEQADSNIFPKYNQNVKKEEKPKVASPRPTPSEPSSYKGPTRNVLTGAGFISKDEFRSKPARKKDGNPVLGVGYDEPAVTSSNTRVPPGGFSKGLW